jgi:RHH-type proline utilization regulon transcriptional repressor/proline dehydrogenase/delta 1-pyrroline-5-carboxylate dehydrogenase
MVEKIADMFPVLNQVFINHLVDTVNQYNQSIELPGPTGESNTLCYHPKGCVLCLGPNNTDALQQSVLSLVLGNSVMTAISQQDYDQLIDTGIKPNMIGRIDKSVSDELLSSDCYDAILYSGNTKAIELTVLDRNAGITPVIDSINEPWRLLNERVVTVDTTAAGGNANLLAL